MISCRLDTAEKKINEHEEQKKRSNEAQWKKKKRLEGKNQSLSGIQSR